MSRHLLLIATAVVLAACGTQEPPSGEEDGATTPAPVPEETTVNGVTDTEVVFGTHTDLSGAIAIWGVGVLNGARMRFDEINEAGGVHGRQVRYIVEDTQYQVPRAIQAANKLIYRDKIFAMLMAVGTPTNNAVMEEQFEAGVPNIFPGSGARSMVEPFRKLMFSQHGTYYDEIRAAVKYFAEKEGRTTPCVMYLNNEYGLEIVEAAQDQAAEMGLEVAEMAAYKITDSEFTAPVIRLRNAGCDVVLMGSVHRDTILILEAARKIGWEDVAWVGNNAAYGQVIADQESGSGEGYYAFVHMAKIYEDDESLTEVERDWMRRYRERYGEEAGLPAMEGYRGGDLVVVALERAGRDLTREKFIAAMESIDDYTDIFGYKIVFGPDDHKGTSESALSVVRNGRWVTLDTSITY
ncbi:MAG: ABC transporter substrate-binding protein [Gammaproteobacteria bacterium]|nr:ABC transporter substrate-binding protein [Gammaproteobacteria bacterium]